VALRLLPMLMSLCEAARRAWLRRRRRRVPPLLLCRQRLSMVGLVPQSLVPPRRVLLPPGVRQRVLRVGSRLPLW